MFRIITIGTFILILLVNSVSADVVGLWLFDEGQGNTVKDSSGKGNSGVINGAKWVDGKFGKALMFDGATTQVVIPSSDSLNVPEQVTVEAWIYPAELHSDINAVAQKWGDISNRRQYQIGAIDAEGSARFYISHSGPDSQRPIGKGIPVDKWTHLAGTFDGNMIRVYINGVLSAELNSPGKINQSNIDFIIGGYGPDAECAINRHFKGIIDEVRVSNVALKENDIQQSMQGFADVSSTGNLSTTWGKLKGE